jgi:hypothetical protein
VGPVTTNAERQARYRERHRGKHRETQANLAADRRALRRLAALRPEEYDDLRAEERAKIRLSGDCPTCGREDVELQQYRKAHIAPGPADWVWVCADAAACNEAYRARRAAR